ncbi:uncharacterized protein LOC122552795 [Chiloscyllium plagiosum]|uniref:uncharacterized protein LOC122552795 n=1 Tax=Chiloscyllium plagiosum TaxID=36176 RepID=UPI001CB81549|nr:uncharacterized protein LOC122552795 [Chiloscyllium plagiosum]
MSFFKSFQQSLNFPSVSSLVEQLSSVVEGLSDAVGQAGYSVADSVTEQVTQILNGLRTEDESSEVCTDNNVASPSISSEAEIKKLSAEAGEETRSCATNNNSGESQDDARYVVSETTKEKRQNWLQHQSPVCSLTSDVSAETSTRDLNYKQVENISSLEYTDISDTMGQKEAQQHKTSLSHFRESEKLKLTEVKKSPQQKQENCEGVDNYTISGCNSAAQEPQMINEENKKFKCMLSDVDLKKSNYEVNNLPLQDKRNKSSKSSKYSTDDISSQINNNEYVANDKQEEEVPKKGKRKSSILDIGYNKTTNQTTVALDAERQKKDNERKKLTRWLLHGAKKSAINKPDNSEKWTKNLEGIISNDDKHSDHKNEFQRQEVDKKGENEASCTKISEKSGKVKKEKKEKKTLDKGESIFPT